ncbi:SEC23 Protein transport protein SEC23 [Candida maltosa Xu316]
MATPLGCLYTPFTDNNVVPKSDGSPTSCQSCQAYLNPYIKINRKNGMWWCPLCEKRSFLPEALAIPETETTVDDWPIEMRETSTVIDYELPDDITKSGGENSPLTYYFVIDKYQHSGDTSFAKLLTSISDIIKELPSGCLIGIMTFADKVQLHKIKHNDIIEISPNDIPETKGKLFQKPSIDKVVKGLHLDKQSVEYKDSSILENDYLIELNESTITSILDYITNIRPVFTDDYKPPRCSGLAHYIYSIMFSQASFRHFIGKVLFFTSGPGTLQPGKIVDSGSSMRTHKEVYDLEAPYFAESAKFYTCLSYISNGQSIEKSLQITNSSSAKTTQHDIDQSCPTWSVYLFAISLDQVGAYEMKPLIASSMGSLFLLESYDSYLLKQMLEKTVIKKSYYKPTLEILTSHGLKSSKMIFSGGYALPSTYHKASKFHHLYDLKIDDELGEFDSPLVKKNFTNRWKFNELDDDDTLSVFFKMDSVKSSEALNQSKPEVYIQFKLHYWDSDKRKWIARVSTVKKQTTSAYLTFTKNKIKSQSLILKEHKFILGFDQRVWIVLLTRLLINKIDTNLGYASFDKLVDIIDGTIIKLLHYFGGISVKFDGSGLSSNPYFRLQTMYEMNENFKELPSLIYNLRKNFNLVKIFNSSPDETAFYHLWFLRMNMPISLKVIEPVLMKITDTGVITRLPLDISCFDIPVKQTSFLVLDTGFVIVLYHQCEENDQRLKLHPSNNDDLIETKDPQLPWDIIDKLTLNRQVIPRIVITQSKHSQSRFLLSRLNPIEKDLPVEITDNKKSGFWSSLFSQQKPRLITDDLSLKQYYDKLIEQV